MRNIAILLLVCLLPAAAGAAHADPACASGMSRAGDLVSAVAARDRGGPHGPSALCEVLRANLRDMREATAIMKRCMTGHALRENVGQMEASMEDVEAAVVARCR